jgi:hypothetical protein
MTQPCKSLGVFIPEGKGWGTCAACGRFIQVDRKKMREHAKPSRFPKKPPSEKEQHDGRQVRSPEGK